MSYEPTVWKDGDLVTSAKLNKLEQGVANCGGILIVHADENGRLDKTWQEIYDADLAVISLIGKDMKFNTLPMVGVNNNIYTVDAQVERFNASAPDDYPIVYTEEETGGESQQ